jgi:transcriptional regulator with XRE-family HTH domain
MKDPPSRDIRIRFGEAVRKRRKELNLSQEDFAERAELHRTYISDIERGTRNVSLENIEKLAKALDLTLPELIQMANNQ